MMCIKFLIVLCIGAFLVQIAFGQHNGCGANLGFANIDPYPYGPVATGLGPAAGIIYGPGANLAPNPSPYLSTAANLIPIEPTLSLPNGEVVVPAMVEIVDNYGGAGMGEVLVVGEMPIEGSTVVTGQVPIVGAVRFAGDVPASGVISLTGTCGCNCGFNNVYM